MTENQDHTLTHHINNALDRTLTHAPGQGTGEPIDKTDWEIGDVIDGRYEVREIIGKGGMGTVYEGYHKEWHIPMAANTGL